MLNMEDWFDPTIFRMVPHNELLSAVKGGDKVNMQIEGIEVSIYKFSVRV